MRGVGGWGAHTFMGLGLYSLVLVVMTIPGTYKRTFSVHCIH